MMKKTDPFFRLDKRVILVSGASSGIGRACALVCEQAGARIIALGRSEEGLARTLEQMSRPEDHLSLSQDLTAFGEVEELPDRIRTFSDSIHGIVHCAGISTTLPFSRTDAGQMDRYFHTNVHAAMNLTRILLKKQLLSGQKGSIVFISSVMGLAGARGKTLYSMTKGALLAGMRSLALELAEKEIRVNAVSPGVVESPMSGKAVYARDPSRLDEVRKLHPLGLGQPVDVAYPVLFLLSDASRWITGENLVVDGGYLTH